jgi:hypothetical protein
MQLMANKVNMPSDTLKKAIIEGWKPELRLFVLNANAKDIQELLSVARNCEAARSADTQSTSTINNLTDMVGSLITKVNQLTTTTAEQNNKKITFAEAAMSSEDSGKRFDVSLKQPTSSDRDYQRQYESSIHR